MAELKTFRADADTGQIFDELVRSGGLIVEGLIGPELLQDINHDVTPLLDGAGSRVDGINPTIAAFFGDRVRHLSGLAGKSRRFAEEVMCNPLLLSICDRVLLHNCADYRLNLAHLMDRGPGAERQMIHRDRDVWIHFPEPQIELQVATMIALVDFTRDNGATCVVPGSHRWAVQREPLEAEIACAEMKAGSAVIYLGSTLHAGGGNGTDEWRRGVHMSYCLGWLRTEENNVLAVPPEQARKLSRRAQELLGYSIHDAVEDMGGYLGMVNLRNPADLLAEHKL